MPALKVHCKTLQGEVIKVQLAEGDRVAGDLVRALASPPHNAVASRVFWRGRPLSKTTALPEAVGRDGEFVTIVLSSSDRKRKKAAQRGSAEEFGEWRPVAGAPAAGASEAGRRS